MKCGSVLFLASLFLFAASVRADEIRLKDGSKINGTIVGYEGDSFKIQTSYGFAMVRKDSIAEIIPTDARKPAAGATSAGTAPEKPELEPASERTPVVSNPAGGAPSKPTSRPELKSAAAPATGLAPTAGLAPSVRPSVAPAPPAASSPVGTAPTLSAAGQPTLAAQPAVATAPAAAPAPPAPPKPEPIQETIRGTLYINQTFGFQMFRPPGWDLIADANQALANAITALGTSDQTTLLVIGHDPVGSSLEAHAAATERKLRDLYENYRSLSTEHTTLSGSPAIETRFRGGLGGHDWSVTVATLARDKEAFTFLAMTYADSDLIQIRENVIAKVLSSVQFTPVN